MRFEYGVTVADGRLDLPLCVGSGQVFRWVRLPSGKWLGVDYDVWFLVKFSESAESGAVSISPATGSNTDRTKDALAFDPLTGKVESRIAAGQFQVTSNADQSRFNEFFRLGWNSDEIEKQVMACAPEFEPYIGTLPGLRLLKPYSAVETFYSFLCTPNNNLTRITAMVNRLAAFGEVFAEVEGFELRKFPGSEVIAGLDPLVLRSYGFGYRGNTIPSIAQQVMERGGDPWIESLRQSPYEEAHAELCKLKGIGPKLADCIALFGLYHTCAVPVDTHVWQALTRLYFPDLKDKALTDQRYRLVSNFLRQRLGENTGWAHQFLFYDNVLNWRSRRSNL